MRYNLLLALMVLIGSAGTPANAQGCKHYNTFNPNQILEANINAAEVLNKARLADSIQRATALLFSPEDTVNAWRHWSSVGNFTFERNRGDIPMITDVNALHPYFRDKVIALIARCKEKGIELAIVETYRTRAKQAEYKSLGKRYTSSGAGRSKHQYGMAIDVVPIVDGKAQWDNLALWRKVGVTGERLGLRWGGRWRVPFDPGHFEWTGGLEPEEIYAGKKPFIANEETLYPCLEEDLKRLRKFWEALEAEQGVVARNK